MRLAEIQMSGVTVLKLNIGVTAAALRSAKHLASAGLVSLPSLVFAFQSSDFFSGKKSNIYNILWVLVFGFATLNILGLITRRLEPRRSSMHLGEILAIAVVVVAVILLGSEMLYLFHVLPVRLRLQ